MTFVFVDLVYLVLGFNSFGSYFLVLSFVSSVKIMNLSKQRTNRSVDFVS